MQRSPPMLSYIMNESDSIDFWNRDKIFAKEKKLLVFLVIASGPEGQF